MGGLRLIGRGQVITRFDTRRVAALLAYLALHLERPHPREVVMERLWPEEDPEATRVRLRTVLASLRRVLEPPGIAPGSILLADRVTVQLNPAAVAVDVAELDAAQRRAASASLQERVALLSRAIDLYHGDLLAGFYDDWITSERERLAEAYVRALLQLSEDRAALGELESALHLARKAIAQDPLREASHLQLLRLDARAGRKADALRHYRELEGILRRELGSEPSEAATALMREIEAGCAIRDTGYAMRDTRYEIRDSGRAPSSVSNPESHISDPESRIALPVSRIPTPAVEPVGGAMPLGSPFYIERPVDSSFHAALARRDSIVLLKGPRQVGKTSLLARGLLQAREMGARVALTDLQKLTAEQLATADALFFTVAEMMAEELDLETPVEELWNPRRGWNVNFERFVRNQVLGSGAPLVWGLDEADRLFLYPFASEVFGLFRSWHNERSLRPSAPWTQLTLAIAYATEAHLFITDLHQSPFNVGMRLELEDFTLAEVAELNRRYGSPLRTSGAVERFVDLLGGHPYLAQRGLSSLKSGSLDIAALEACAAQERGPFGDHLRRLRHSLSQDPTLREALREALCSGRCPTDESFYRLRSAGVLLGDSREAVRPRCRLYRLYLESVLR